MRPGGEPPRVEVLPSPDELAARSLAHVVPAIRSYLAATQRELAAALAAGHPGRELNELHSERMDRLLDRLVRLARAELGVRAESSEASFAVVAVGGYARREMAPASDVDLLLLHGGAVGAELRHLAERLHYWLWDSGVRVGCATRSAAETVELAHADETVFTSVLDTRLLYGSRDLHERFEQTVRRELLRDPAARTQALIEGVRERHARYGDSLYLLQPNIKEGEGGLRDYHAALWCARIHEPSVRHVDDFVGSGLLMPAEAEELAEALDFLWRVRHALHHRTGRKDDQMSFEHQEGIAESFGYARQPSPNVLPVEQFMADYYRRARVVRNHTRLVLEQCRARVRGHAAWPPRVQLEDGFVRVGDELEIPSVAHLRSDPLRMLRVFEVSQQHDIPLSTHAQRMLRQNLDLVETHLRDRPEAAASFLRILAAPRRVMRSLMTMNEIGLLGRFLPEWEHIVCRWQHVVYHTYTVDVHSIFLVEELRRLWRRKYERALPELTAIVHRVDDLPVLFLGCLLHDIGKGTGEDHSIAGERLARRCLERLHLEPARAERVLFLVRHHLAMSHLAQRRDFTDARTLLQFARTVGDRVNLRNLYLLTFADIRASSPAAWTEWKGMLLRELFERTAELLESGTDDPRRALEWIERGVERRRQAAREELRALGVGEQKIEAFFEDVPRRYFIAHTAHQIARHALVVIAFAPEKGLAFSVREVHSDFAELIVCAPDRHGLYAQVTGTLAGYGLNILASSVYTLRSGLALEIYRVSLPPGSPSERRERWRLVEEGLRRVLSGELAVESLLRGRRRPLGRALSPRRKEPQVTISNEESEFYTVIDVWADDRLGLLYDLTHALTAQGLEIFISKVATALDQVADTFYVKEEGGGKLTDPKRIAAVRQALLEAARGGDGRGGA